jgi:hypothetical protein
MDPLHLYERSLVASLDELAVPEVQALPPEQAGLWNLPAADIEAYRRWGLPIVAPSQFTPSFQPEPEPRIEDVDRRLYQLGTVAHADLVATEHTGVVEALPRLKTSTSKTWQVNASGALLVDTAWRWYGVNTALRAVPFDDETYDRLDRFWDLVREKDPTLGENSLWWGLVQGW